MRNNEPLEFFHSVLHFSFEIAKIAGVFFVAWWRNLHPPSLFSRELAENEVSTCPARLQRLITSSYRGRLRGDTYVCPPVPSFVFFVLFIPSESCFTQFGGSCDCLNFDKIHDTGPLCVILSVSIFVSFYITEVDIIIFVFIFFIFQDVRL